MLYKHLSFWLSSPSKEIEFNLEWVLKDIVNGKTLLLVKGVDCVAKKSLKRFSFFLKSNLTLLFTNNGGINGTLVSICFGSGIKFIKFQI